MNYRAAGCAASGRRCSSRLPLDRTDLSGENDRNLGWATMPRISQFYGIAIYMYYRDHAPPHFHAIYGEKEAAFEIATGTTLIGKLPRRAHALVEEWAAMRRPELEHDWDLALTGQPLLPIDPLD